MFNLIASPQSLMVNDVHLPVQPCTCSRATFGRTALVVQLQLFATMGAAPILRDRDRCCTSQPPHRTSSDLRTNSNAIANVLANRGIC